MLQHRAKVAEKVGAKNLEILKKMGTKKLQNGGPNPPKSSPEGAKRGPGRPENRKKRQTQQKTPVPQLVPPILGEKVANMDPSWPSKSQQNRRKIDAKIDRKNDASWNRFLEGFWWIFGGKMEACWHQNREKIEANFEERFFEKSYSRYSGGLIFQVRGV